MIETSEILQTMRMIQEENFDIRTITLGINCWTAPIRMRRSAPSAYMTRYAARRTGW